MKLANYGAYALKSLATHCTLISLTDESANSSTSENGDQEEACPRSTRKFGELSHDKASSKSSKNLRKRARSKSMEDETGSDLKARSHKQSKVRASSPHEEAKRGKSKRKHKQKSADRCGSGKSPAGMWV